MRLSSQTRLLITALAASGLLLGYTHRNSDDVGRAADLAAAREAIAGRVGDGDPFDPVARGVFVPIESHRVETVAKNGTLVKVVMGKFDTTGDPAISIFLDQDPTKWNLDHVIRITVSASGNGAVTSWPGNSVNEALVEDLASGSTISGPRVEMLSDRVIIPLPSFFDAESPWEMNVVIP